MCVCRCGARVFLSLVAGTAGTKSAGGGGEGAVAADAASRSSVGLGHRSCVTVCVREAPLGALFATLLLSFGATAAGVGLYFGLTDLRASLGLRHDWCAAHSLAPVLRMPFYCTSLLPVALMVLLNSIDCSRQVRN